MIEWQWAPFRELGSDALCEALAARQNVFVLEQQCLYADIDGADPQAYHLIGWNSEHGTRQLQAYLRCFAPGDKYAEAALGRILTVQSARGAGLGKQLMAEGIRRVEQYFPGSRIRLSAQQHLERFYRGFGFIPISDVFLEDGIPHIEMLR